jgi:Type I restriction enzyme R protein N terminus (HSDR_N)
MTDETRFDQFLDWLQALDPYQFQNEAEVESKFVVPLFQHLGYPEKCRRPQYSLKIYESSGRGRRGRGQAIDQIYFSSTKQQEQTPDTSLLIVEAKEPNETHFDEALEQARSYGYRLTPLFLVVTNALRLLVVKRHGFRGEEQVFDVTLLELQEKAVAHRLYRELYFDVVKRLKEQLTDELTHTLYIDLLHALDRHPDLRDQMAKGDFERSRTQEGRRLTVIEPKVAVVCDLPLAFGDGSCRIEFSNLLLQGLTCQLTHRQILESLTTGLDTQPDWGTRRFLHKTKDGSFEAQLGQTTVILSEQEAKELCTCIDDVCHVYKAILVNTEDTLQTWDYLPKSMPRSQLHGFNLLTVEPWLWKLMRRFVREFDFLAGTSPWHIFDRENFGLRVHHGQEVENALIYP